MIAALIALLILSALIIYWLFEGVSDWIKDVDYKDMEDEI